MKVKSILNEFLSRAIPSSHKVRRKALVDCVDSILYGSKLTVTGVGRGIDGDAYEKHRIKRSDRLCSNPYLLKESRQIYGEICKQWIPVNSRPVLLVDWSDLDGAKRSFLISATLVYDGRSITLYSEVHSSQTNETPQAHRLFIQRLKDILPDNCRPIIVADAGFKVPWHKLILEMGWDYVGRVRRPNYYSSDRKKWRPVTKLFKQATRRVKCFPGFLTKSNQFKTNFVLFKGKTQGRHKYTATGERCQSRHSKVHAKRGKEPWLLTTSLSVSPRTAKKIVRIYRHRMQIEEGFRDFKSALFGFGFEFHASKHINRLAILMLMAVLASMILLLIGTAAEQANLSRRYQANTVKDRRVLSLSYLGKRILADRRAELATHQIQQALYHMQEVIAQASYGLE